MKRAIIMAALTLLHLYTTPALAQSAPRCGPGDAGCAASTEAGQKPGQTRKAAPESKAEPQKSRATPDTRELSGKEQAGKAPKVGEVARSGRALKTDEARKLAKPTTGRAYRVVEDRVVLVDAGTMKVLQVLGLASDILR